MHELSSLSAAVAGRYQIERQIGAGGMATVYLATDVRHHRKVAVKVLRQELAAVIGAERFLAEIKTTASLQHPHILPLHDSGEAGGTVFYVMPFVEGESLRDRIVHEKQLPIDEAIRIATQVAAALDYAHRQGVVHRDIKPENVLLQDGQALVADFGIALAVSRSNGGSRLTETGMSLGTPHYMAPEQAMGERDITAKADVYALGCVLYEMLSGEPPFTGATAQAIIARAMTESPRSLVVQRHTVPTNVQAAVSTALEKLPADRFASAGEFAAALANPLYGQRAAASADSDSAVRHQPPRSRLAAPLAAVTMIAVTALAWILLRPMPPRPVTRFGVAFAPEQAPLPDLPFVISADGSRLMYVGPGSGAGGQLWIKERDQLKAVPMMGTANAISFTFSPDGQSIAFVTTDGVLKKLSLQGGASVTLTDSAGPIRGLAWLDDGSILFSGLHGYALRRILDAGGKPETVWASDSANAYIADGIPGSRGALIVVCSHVSLCGSPADVDLFVFDLRSRSMRRLASRVTGARYAPTGHVVYVQSDGRLMALPFSVRSLKSAGSAVPLQDGIPLSSQGPALFDVSREGTMFIGPGSSEPMYEMVWVDRAGRESPVDSTWTFHLTKVGGNAGWALSPDGTRLAIGLNSEAGDVIWIKQLPRGPLARLSFDTASESRPRWSGDGRTVLFQSLRLGVSALFSRSSDATGSDQIVFKSTRDIFEGVVSPDGKYLVVRTGGKLAEATGRDISIVRLGVDSAPRPLIATPSDEEAFALSPDGRWIAYESNETGRTEIYLRPFPNADGGKWQVSTDGGVAPLWSRNGRELFFVNGSRSMVVVPLASGATPQLGEQKSLFRMRPELYLSTAEFYTPYDLSPDGQRFIMARRTTPGPSHVGSMVMVQNWFEELKTKVGRK